MLDEMILSKGQVLRGRNATYRLLNALHAPTVFKAQVLDSLTVKAELYITLIVVIFNILVYQFAVRWSKQYWSPLRKP